MKLFNYLSIITLGLVIISACSTTSSNDKGETESQESCIYTYDNESLNFKWTAYKFTNKTGVNGGFDDIIVTSDDDATSLEELLNSIGFSINTGSVNSNEVIRDLKIAQFFFGTMENTSVINGDLKNIEGGNAIIALTINDLTIDVPGTIEVNGDTIKLKSTVDFKAFEASEALSMLNQVCSEKHTGEDGKSVLWDVVDIDVQALVKEECK
jgi:hypothetical protein